MTRPGTLLGRWSAGLWALLACLWLLDVLGRGLPLLVDRAAALAALGTTATWAGARLLALRGRGAAAWLLPGLLALSLTVRFAGLGHEADGRYYRDEGTYYHHASKINAGKPLRLSFVYPHLTYYADAFALWLAGLFPGATAALARGAYGAETPLGVSWVVLRGLVALASALTVIPVWRLGERLGGRLAGAVGSLLLILSPLYNEGSHLNTCDVPSAFFATLCLAAAARLLDAETLRGYTLAGLWAGLAAASKYPAGVVAVAIVAVWLRWRLARRDLAPGLLVAGAAALAAFLAAMPSLLVFPRAALFGSRGMLFGYRQYGQGGWLGVMPGNNALFYWETLAASFGLPALLAGASGLFLLGRDERRRLLWLLPFPALYLALIAAMNMVVKRNLYPAVPALAAFLGAGVAAWLGFARQRLAWPRPAARAAAAVLALACLLLPAGWTLAQAAAFSRPSTRDVAAAWIRRHLPPGAAILKETYTPNFPPGELAVTHRRFVARLTLREIRAPRHDWALLAGGAYERFVKREAFAKPHQRLIRERYLAIFRTFELVREWRPGRLRRGPVLRLYRIPPDPAACRGEAALPAAGAFVPDPAQREAPRRLAFLAPGQWALFRACLERGRYAVAVDGRPGGGPGLLRVAQVDGREVTREALASGEGEVDLPGRGKYLFYLYLPPGSRVRGLSLLQTP